MIKGQDDKILAKKYVRSLFTHDLAKVALVGA